MKIVYDPAFLESVARRALRRAEETQPRLVASYHRDANAFYGMEETARESGFAKLHLEVLRDLGLEQALIAGLRPAIKRINEVLVLDAKQKREEFVDLATDGVLRLRLGCWRFDDTNALASYLERQLVHVSDLLDPAFGFVAEPRLGRTVAEDTLVRDRYRVLWEISVLARVKSDDSERARLEGDVAHLWPRRQSDQVLIYSRFALGPRPTHSQLLACARDVRALLAFVGIPAGKDEPAPGFPCPLCKFPTHNWRRDTLTAGALASIRREFPGWQPEHGICDRCADIYELARASAGA